MNAPGIDPRVLDVLQNASSLELFQLEHADRAIVGRSPAHHCRTQGTSTWGRRCALWTGDGSLREGKVVAMREAQDHVAGLARNAKRSCPTPRDRTRRNPIRQRILEAVAPEPPAAAADAQRLPLRREGRLRRQYLQTVVGTIVRASTAAPPPSTPATAPIGASASPCCATSWTSGIPPVLLVKRVLRRRLRFSRFTSLRSTSAICTGRMQPLDLNNTIV